MPSDLILTYRGNGWFQTRTGYDLELAERRFKIGAFIRAKLSVPRSLRQHRLFFGWVTKVWENLPWKRNEFPTAEHLRSYLTYRAGHVNAFRIPPELYGPEIEHIIKMTLRAVREDEHKDVYFEEHDDIVWAMIPKSIAWSRMDHLEFQPFFDKCEAVVADELLPGISLDGLLASLGDPQ